MVALVLFVLAFGVGGKNAVDKYELCKSKKFKSEFCKTEKKLYGLKDFSLHK